MNTSSQTKFFQRTSFICSIAVLLNLLISYCVLFYKQPFNVDGILYLSSAQAFLTGGLKSAMAVYSWPFYSVLIALLSKLTQLPLETAAFVLNALLTSVLVTAFILLVKKWGEGVNTQYFALLVILCFSYLNHDRDNILRDFGYYAFLLVSLLLFIRYLKELKWRHAIAWNIVTIIATLFRIEGIILLALAPLLIFATPHFNFKQKLIAFLQANFFPILGTIGLLIFIDMQYQQQKFASVGRVSEIINNAHVGMTVLANTITVKSKVIAHYVFNSTPNKTAFLFLLGGMVAMFLETLFGILGLLYVVLILFTFIKKITPKNESFNVAFYSYCLIIFLTLIYFLAQQFFLSQRYVAPLCLILMLSIPFGINYIYKNQRWTFHFLSLLFLIMSVASFGHFGTSKTYIIDAGVWLKESTVPLDRVYTNSAQLAYYSDRPGTRYPQDFIERNRDNLLKKLTKINLNNYNYVALQINHPSAADEKKLIAFFKKTPIKVFSNSKEDKILIFKITDNNTIKITLLSTLLTK